MIHSHSERSRPCHLGVGLIRHECKEQFDKVNNEYTRPDARVTVLMSLNVTIKRAKTNCCRSVTCTITFIEQSQVCHKVCHKVLLIF